MAWSADANANTTSADPPRSAASESIASATASSSRLAVVAVEAQRMDAVIAHVVHARPVPAENRCLTVAHPAAIMTG